MIAALRWWMDLLDRRFRIPGTDIRFGIDPILSFVPVLGELVTPLFTMVLLAHAVSLGVPRVVLARMAINALVNAAIGAVPVVGNVGDVFWRANVMNLDLLERHARPGVRPAPGDYAFVWGVTAALGLLLAIPIVAGVVLMMALVNWMWGA